LITCYIDHLCNKISPITKKTQKPPEDLHTRSQQRTSYHKIEKKRKMDGLPAC
jgi:hypothetical protein